MKKNNISIRNVEIGVHHIIHYIGLPFILIGSDIFIGFYGHFVGSAKEFTWNNIVAYLTTPEEQTELAMVLIGAILITLIVEWIVRQRIKHHKK